ncbi:MAG: hypothetical protein IJX90_00145 [Blautia sp.]|nr:hypothetical protein [Blautia sp.]
MMNMTYLVLAVIMLIVFFVVPYVIGKRTGRSFREVLLGKKSPKEQKKDGSGTEEQKRRQKNGNRNDILEFMSSLVSFCRKNDCDLVMPGTLKGETDTAMFTAVLVMPARVVGITCFGYGGTVLAKQGEENWIQTLNGQKIKIKNPVIKNEQQLEILKEVLKKAGHDDAPSEVISVFTSPKVELMNAGKSGCFTRRQFFEKIREDRFMNGRLKTEQIAEALRFLIIRE